jgi:hypothetical protein
MLQEGGNAVRIEVADERAARAELRAQIAGLERRLADAVVSGFPHGGVDDGPSRRRARRAPRLLSLGELEVLRDELAGRVARAHEALAARGEREARSRELLERMLADPGAHRFARLHRSEVGMGGCGAYEVRPRLGLIGMLAGWWHVKLSSGCPLAT